MPRRLGTKPQFNQYYFRSNLKFLEKEKVESIIKQSKRKRDELMLRLMFECGLRASETLTLRKIDIREDYLVVRGKGGKTRIVPVSNNLRDELLDFIEVNKIREDAEIFKITRIRVWQIVRECAEKAGLGYLGVHPHTLRHSFAVRCLEKDLDIRTLQKILGHNKLDTTATYLDITPKIVLDKFKKIDF